MEAVFTTEKSSSLGYWHAVWHEKSISLLRFSILLLQSNLLNPLSLEMQIFIIYRSHFPSIQRQWPSLCLSQNQFSLNADEGKITASHKNRISLTYLHFYNQHTSMFYTVSFINLKSIPGPVVPVGTGKMWVGKDFTVLASEIESTPKKRGHLR